MTFGSALDIIKSGGKVARKGWNGKGMYLYLGEGEGEYHDPFIVMYTAKGTHQAGWLASQADMLSDDWVRVD